MMKARLSAGLANIGRCSYHSAALPFFSPISDVSSISASSQSSSSWPGAAPRVR